MKSTLSRLLAAAFFVFAGSVCAADVGRVLLAAGDVVAVRNNQPVKLALGSVIQDNDVLRTGAASNLQVRFTDESIVSLRENSELRIEEFSFSGKEDGSERAFFRLLRGGLRVVSGLVGRTNQKNFRLNSVVTSMGIRGTDFATALCQQDCRNADGSLAKDGQYGRVHGQSHGTNRIDVTNELEQKVFGINENFYAADANSVIEPLLVPPDFVANRLQGRKQGGDKAAGGTGGEQVESGGAGGDSRATTDLPPPVPPPLFVATENRDESGSLTVVDGSPQMIAGVGAGAFGVPGDPGDSGGFFAPADLTTEPAGAASNLSTPQKLLAFTLQAGNEAHTSPSSVPITGSATSSASVHDETGPNAIGAHWGRWESGSVTNGFGTTPITTNNQFHYLYGPLATPEVVAAKSGTFAMNLVGGTTPTNQAGQAATLFSLSTFTVDFTARTVTFPTINMNFPSDNFTFPGPNTTAIQFAAGKGAFIDHVVAGTCTGINCVVGSQSATLGKTGVFMGSSGNHLGISFQARQDSGPAFGQTSKIYSCAPSC